MTAAAVIEHLDEWWGPSAITHDASSHFPNVGIGYAQPDDVEVHADADMQMSICAGPLTSFERRHVSLAEEIRLELRAAAPQPLSAFQRRVHACQDLLSIASLTLCGVED